MNRQRNLPRSQATDRSDRSNKFLFPMSKCIIPNLLAFFFPLLAYSNPTYKRGYTASLKHLLLLFFPMPFLSLKLKNERKVVRRSSRSEAPGATQMQGRQEGGRKRREGRKIREGLNHKNS